MVVVVLVVVRSGLRNWDLVMVLEMESGKVLNPLVEHMAEHVISFKFSVQNS